jgi:hypothetical protein
MGELCAGFLHDAVMPTKFRPAAQFSGFFAWPVNVRTASLSMHGSTLKILTERNVLWTNKRN